MSHHHVPHSDDPKVQAHIERLERRDKTVEHLFRRCLHLLEQAIAELVDGDEPLTWLFMGDSITHGARYTFGRDSISQMFEKFLKDDLGRTDDIVINTAVSSADTNDTITELEARLTRYQPDVVSIMIGTNDSATHINVGETKYKENLRTIIAAIKAEGAKVILRTPVPTKDGTRPEIGNYADWMGEVADEYEDVILVEQYDSMRDVFTAAPYMIPVLFNSGDYLHPTTEGQLWMLDRFLEETGMSHDGYLANLWYETGATSEISDAEIPAAHVLEALLLHPQDGVEGVHEQGIQFRQSIIHGFTSR